MDSDSDNSVSMHINTKPPLFPLLPFLQVFFCVVGGATNIQ